MESLIHFFIIALYLFIYTQFCNKFSLVMTTFLICFFNLFINLVHLIQKFSAFFYSFIYKPVPPLFGFKILILLIIF